MTSMVAAIIKETLRGLALAEPDVFALLLVGICTST